jgi:cellulose synthase/poly-beta-1,6-N-acetylglucosamine synthase-like glycosyltransferase
MDPIFEFWTLHIGLGLLVILVFDLPRDLLSFLSIGLSRLFEVRKLDPVHKRTVTVVIPAFNAENNLLETLQSISTQTLAVHQVIVICDGSSDHTWRITQSAKQEGLVHVAIRNSRRLGVSASSNKALLYATGELVLFVDSDTMLMPDACEELVRRMDQGGYAAVSGNIGVRNVQASLWTALQQVEYMFGIDFGRSFSSLFDAISCLSGAMTIFQKDALMAVGGFSPGSGQDLEVTLRLRFFGYRIGFASRAWAYTHVPETGMALIKQRLRWTRDAIRIHIFQYKQFHKAYAGESLGNTLQRYDFLTFNLIPTLLLGSIPLVVLSLPHDHARIFILTTYFLLLTVAFCNLTLGFLFYRGSVNGFSLLLLPIVPLYYGVFLKSVSLYAYISEALWHASKRGNFIPARIREILYKD